MKPLHRALLIFLGLPLIVGGVLVVLWAASALSASWQERAFYSIPQNAPRADVVAALGAADRVRACGKNLWWGDDSQYRGPNDGRCVSEERYEHFLTAYGIGYSADGRVVSKYRYVSE